MIFRIELSGGGWGGDRGFKLPSLGIFNSTMLCYFPLFLAFPTTLGILLSAPSIPASNAPPAPVTLRYSGSFKILQYPARDP